MMDHMRCPECSRYQPEYFGHMGNSRAIWECRTCETKLGFDLDLGCGFGAVLGILTVPTVFLFIFLDAWDGKGLLAVSAILGVVVMMLFMNRIEKVSEDRESPREKRRRGKDPRAIKIGSRDVRF